MISKNSGFASLEAKTFPWSVVESVHDAADLLKCESPEIGALGQVLPDEPVGVLVESKLPGMVGVGEVALGVESLGDGLMVGELLAVVIGGACGQGWHEAAVL